MHVDRQTQDPARIAALRSAWREDGFVVVRGAFGPPEVAAAARAFERLEAMAQTLPPGRATLHHGAQFVLGPRLVGGAPRLDRVVWCAAADATLDGLGQDLRLRTLAAILLGSAPWSVATADQLISQAHFKLPGDGVSFGWHQDSVHRRHGTPLWDDVDGEGSYVQTVLAIDAADDRNGALGLVRGSHTAGHRAEVPVVPRGDPRVVRPALAPGDVVCFGPYVLHGSEPNRSNAPRRAFINGFAAAGANHRNYPGFGAGRRLALPRGPRQSAPR